MSTPENIERALSAEFDVYAGGFGFGFVAAGADDPNRTPQD